MIYKSVIYYASPLIQPKSDILYMDIYISCHNI